MSVALRSTLFTLLVPGTGAVLIPSWMIYGHFPDRAGSGWPGVILIILGAGLYLWCLRLFATVGGGTPGPWDAPRRVVAVGPYRWVRNPIYLAALTVVAGEAWLFGSTALLEYAAVMAVTVHLFVVGYEEPTLRRRFGTSYIGYTDRVPRWVPHRPQHA